eukprot:6191860-Pleurochrysis_carterae.AAC.1
MPPSVSLLNAMPIMHNCKAMSAVRTRLEPANVIFILTSIITAADQRLFPPGKEAWEAILNIRYMHFQIQSHTNTLEHCSHDWLLLRIGWYSISTRCAATASALRTRSCGHGA